MLWRCKSSRLWDYMLCQPMIGENRLLVTIEPVEFEKQPVEVQDFKKMTNTVVWNVKLLTQSNKNKKKKQSMSTYIQLDLEHYGFHQLWLKIFMDTDVSAFFLKCFITVPCRWYPKLKLQKSLINSTLPKTHTQPAPNKKTKPLQTWGCKQNFP